MGRGEHAAEQDLRQHLHGADQDHADDSGCDLRAMAYKTGMTDSAITAGTYELWPASDCGGGGGNQSEPPDGSATAPVYGANGNMATGWTARPTRMTHRTGS